MRETPTIRTGQVLAAADGSVKILDFELAKLLQPDVDPGADKTRMADDTAEGVVMGTAAYMSPEQGRGKRSTSAVL